jgi:hypothetical protein
LGYFAFTSFLGLDQIESTYSFGWMAILLPLLCLQSW